MTAPTPPADTRQQAAEALTAWSVCHEDVYVTEGDHQPCEKQAVAIRFEPEEQTPYPVCRRHVRGGMATFPNAVLIAVGQLLASSSPALPEPPAPSSTGVDNTTWHPVFSASVVADWSLGGVWSFGPDRRMTPAEARRLASTLLAAADVAEEQQP